MGIAALAAATTLRAQTSGGRVLGARAAIGTVAIKAWNPAGSIRFVAWDKDSVVVRGTAGRNLRFLLAGDSAGIKVGPEGHWSDGQAEPSNIVVYIPRHATVSAKTVSANIIGEGTSGWFYTVSGSIRLSGASTSVEAESMTGSLDINVSTPWVKARTGSGHLLLRGTPQDADVSTVGGTLSIATSSVLRGQFASVTGDIHYAPPDGPAPTAILEFANHRGAVDLLLPSNASAALTLSSIAGPIQNGFARVRPAAETARSMRINLGRGEAQLTARTFKGTIRLRTP